MWVMCCTTMSIGDRNFSAIILWEHHHICWLQCCYVAHDCNKTQKHVLLIYFIEYRGEGFGAWACNWAEFIFGRSGLTVSYAILFLSRVWKSISTCKWFLMKNSHHGRSCHSWETQIGKDSMSFFCEKAGANASSSVTPFVSPMDAQNHCRDDK